MRYVFATVSMLSFVLSGCALGTPDHGVRIVLPPGSATPESAGAGAGLFRLDGGTPFAAFNLAAPASYSGFNCYAVNVMASDIPRDSTMNVCPDEVAKHYYPGKLFGTVSAAQGYIDVDVPGGPQRTVQLIGMVSSGACPAIADLVANRVASATISPAYEIGRGQIDLFQDSTLSIHQSYSPANPNPLFCSAGGGGGGGGTPTQIVISPVGAPALIASGQCTPFYVKSLDAGGAQAPMPSGAGISVGVTIDTAYGTSTTAYPSQAQCSSATSPLTTTSGAATNYLSIPGGSSSVAFYVKSYGALDTSFHLTPTTTATGYTLNPLSLMIRDTYLQITPASVAPFSRNTCTGLTVGEYTGGAVLNATANTSITLKVSAFGASASPAVSFYPTPACTGAASGTGSSLFTINAATGAPVSGTIYFLDTAGAPENVNFLVEDTQAPPMLVTGYNSLTLN